MAQDRTKTLKQPSVLRFRNADVGFTLKGFTFSLNLQYDEEFAEENPAIPIMRHIIGCAPVLSVEMLQTDEDALSAAFGGYYDAGSLKVPGSIVPGTDVYDDEKFTGELQLHPKISQRGWYIEGKNVFPVIRGAQRLSVLDRVVLAVDFIFQFDSNDQVIDIDFRSS